MRCAYAWGVLRACCERELSACMLRACCLLTGVCARRCAQECMSACCLRGVCSHTRCEDTSCVLRVCCVHACACVSACVHYLHACCVCTACEHACVQWYECKVCVCTKMQDVPRYGCLGESGVYVREQIGIQFRLTWETTGELACMLTGKS